MKNLFFILVFLAAINISATAATKPTNMGSAYCVAQINNGTFMPTNHSVTVYSESGHNKGSYTVYLHGGHRYIKFNNSWICIQGRSRFAHAGNWYIIK